MERYSTLSAVSPAGTPSLSRACLALSYACLGVLLFPLRWHRNRFLRPGCQNSQMALAQSALER